MATAPKKSSPTKTVEKRLADLEKSVNSVLSAVTTLSISFSESHSAFVNEISRLKTDVAALKKRV